LEDFGELLDGQPEPLAGVDDLASGERFDVGSEAGSAPEVDDLGVGLLVAHQPAAFLARSDVSSSAGSCGYASPIRL
jgi:hypothetical protein